MKTKVKIVQYFNTMESKTLLENTFEGRITNAILFAETVSDYDTQIKLITDSIERPLKEIAFLRWLKEGESIEGVQDYLDASGEDADFLKPFVKSLRNPEELNKAKTILSVAAETVNMLEMSGACIDELVKPEAILRKREKIYRFLSTFKN